MNSILFKINKSFKDKLITGILSSPIIYVPHFHYSYIDQALREIVYPESGYNILGLSTKSIAEYGVEGSRINFNTKVKNTEISIETVLTELIDRGHLENKEANPTPECIFLIKNSYVKLQELKCQRLLQTFAGKYERGELPREMTIIFVSPEPMESLPEQVEKLIYVVEVPRPTEQEIADYLQNIPVSSYFATQAPELRIDLTRALQGLQHYEIEQIIMSATIRSGGTITEKTIKYALEEKKNIVKKSGIIEVVDTDISFDDIGGLEILREDLRAKAILFKHLNEIGSAGIPIPKGVLILGMPGCGKSLIAKSIANEFGVSLLRLDINRLMGQYVGQSEANLRKALATAEAAHPCVLWIDEIEKAFAGANGGASGSNNDIVMRLMGHFLTWMQERKTAVYIVATANDVMRPEFMRKGRFDEVYFVDFPKDEERVEILRKKIDRYKRTTAQQQIYDTSSLTEEDIQEIALQMVGKKDKKQNYGFSGSEIESVVTAVMEKKFVAYLIQSDKTKQKTRVVITKEDFIEQINIIRDSVMSNQEGKKDASGKKEETSVERIRQLQEVYKFRLASK